MCNDDWNIAYVRGLAGGAFSIRPSIVIQCYCWTHDDNIGTKLKNKGWGLLFWGRKISHFLKSLNWQLFGAILVPRSRQEDFYYFQPNWPTLPSGLILTNSTKIFDVCASCWCLNLSDSQKIMIILQTFTIVKRHLWFIFKKID